MSDKVKLIPASRIGIRPGYVPDTDAQWAAKVAEKRRRREAGLSEHPMSAAQEAHAIWVLDRVLEEIYPGTVWGDPDSFSGGGHRFTVNGLCPTCDKPMGFVDGHPVCRVCDEGGI